MPERYLHEKITKILLNEKCSRTHKFIDYPVKYLGRRHRILFHDPLSAFLIGLVADGYKGAIAGILHILTDKYINTKFRKEALKLLIKFYELM